MNLNERGQQLIASVLGGAYAPSRREGWHVKTDAFGRVRVATRDNGARHTNWYTFTNLDHRCDHVALVEFSGIDPVGAWMLSRQDVQRFAYYQGERTRFAMSGAWRAPSRRLELN